VTSPVNMKGSVELPIKIYRPNTHPDFPNGGIMTNYLENIPVGTKVRAVGPKKRMEYFGNGFVRVYGKIVK